MASSANNQADAGKCPVCKIDLYTHHDKHQRGRHMRRCEKKQRLETDKKVDETPSERKKRMDKEATRKWNSDRDRIVRKRKREEVAADQEEAVMESAPTDADDSKKKTKRRTPANSHGRASVHDG